MKPTISVRNVIKTYEEGASKVPALQNVSLDIFPGEVMLLMGPSGSGKTTLLSIMGCILRPTSGSVYVNGIETSLLSEKELPAIRLEHIGFIFQGFNLFPTLTVGENVALALDLKGIRGSKASQEARRLLTLVALDQKYDAFPGDLSGGQKQRVAVARALAGSPSVILADEPTAALDGTTGRTVMQTMLDLAHRHGRAVVVVTHDSRVLEFADRIVHMEDGRIVDGGHELEIPRISPQTATGNWEVRTKSKESSSQ